METICNINNAFDPGTTNELKSVVVQRSFERRQELENEECSSQSSEGQWQPSAIIKVDPLTTTWEVAKELNGQPFYGHIWHLKQIGKKKSSVNRCLMNQSKKKKKIAVWMCFLLYSSQVTISWLDCML